LIYSPIVARAIATIAELCFYQAEANWLRMEFFGASIGRLAIVGELVCWSHLLLQSDLVGNIEDTIWTLMYAKMAVNAKTNLQFTFYAVFCAFMIVVHLPRMFQRSNLRFPLYRGAVVKTPDADTKAWVVPMLFAMPLIYTLCLLDF